MATMVVTTRKLHGRRIHVYDVFVGGKHHVVVETEDHGKVIYDQEYRGFHIRVIGIGVAGAFGWVADVYNWRGEFTRLAPGFYTTSGEALRTARASIDNLLKKRLTFYCKE